MQFMIFLSALLASLTGLVAGERQPVRAQVEMSAVGTAAAVEKAVAAVQPVAGSARATPSASRPLAASLPAGHAVRVSPSRTRLALKQSWLF